MGSSAENLIGKHYITVLVRFRIDPSAGQVQGEVVDMVAQTQGRFLGWEDLVVVLQSIVSALTPGEPTNPD